MTLASPCSKTSHIADNQMREKEIVYSFWLAVIIGVEIIAVPMLIVLKIGKISLVIPS